MAIGCMPKLDSKIQLLKILFVHALIVGHEKTRLGLNWKLSACWLAFIVPEVAHRLLSGNCHQHSCSTMDPVCANTNIPGRCTTICNAGLAMMGKTNSLSIEFMAPSQERVHIWYCKPK